MATILINFEELACASCSMVFFVPKDFNDRRQKDHKTFYCPNMHSNIYEGEPEEKKLRRRLDERDEEIVKLHTQIRALTRKPRKKREPKK